MRANLFTMSVHRRRLLVKIGSRLEPIRSMTMPDWPDRPGGNQSTGEPECLAAKIACRPAKMVGVEEFPRSSASRCIWIPEGGVHLVDGQNVTGRAAA